MFIVNTPLFLGLIFICLCWSLLSHEQKPLSNLLKVFFGCLFLVELACYWFKINDWNNSLIYNLWFPIEFVFYTYWVSVYLQKHKLSIIFRRISVAYLILVLLIYLIAWDLNQFNGLAYQLGFLLLLPLLLYKLNEMIREPAMLNPLRNPVFWLVTGLLFSYLFSFCQFSIQGYLLTNKHLSEALKKLNIILTDILYVCLILFFVFKWKQEKSHT